MTARPLTFDFPAMTPPIARPGADALRLSIRPPHAIPEDERLLALVLERDRRRTAYPRMVTAGRLTEEDARRHTAILAAIIVDCTEPPPSLEGRAFVAFCEEQRAARAACPWRWEDKVRELRREIQLRRNTYPKWIAAGRIDEPEARLHLERLEGIHWHYWIRLRFWNLPPGHVPHGHPNFYDPIRQAAAAVEAWLWSAHQAGDPAVRNYLTPEQIAWHASQQEAA